jgi:hypothetical protein
LAAISRLILVAVCDPLVGGSAIAYGRIRSQNHRVETTGTGNLLDG